MASRSNRGTILFLFSTFLLTGTPLLFAQNVPGPALVEDVPEEYEETVRDLVERYEELRTLLREQIQVNTELYSQAEIDTATADLREELDELERVNTTLRQDYKRVLVAAKNAAARSRRTKEELAKTRTGLTGEINTLERVIASVEEETLLQVGGTFSPAGRIGVLGQINLPGTNVGLLTEGIYDLREQTVTTAFGVSFGFFPQGSIVEGWERLRNRFRGTKTEQPEEAGTAPTDTETTDSASGEQSTSQTAPPQGSGTLFRPNRPVTE